MTLMSYPVYDRACAARFCWKGELFMSLAHEAFIEWQKRRNAAAVHLDLQSTALVSIDMQEWPTNPTSPFWRYGERRTPGLRDYFLAQVEGAVTRTSDVSLTSFACIGFA
jgi:hypothetical protein